KKLCEQFGVSRTPLREALKVLASYGLVRLKLNRGAWVSKVTIKEVEEVFPILGALEALAGEFACQNITNAEIQAVIVLHKDMVQSYHHKDMDTYFTLNQHIHRSILLAAKNDTLTTACKSLSLRIKRARYLANITEARWAKAVQEHDHIIKFLEAKDGQKLAHALVEHMKANQQSIVSWLQKKVPDNNHKLV
ncbi:MAG: GntR family transcriptional regulator, partial [Paracoccaceae bacterium]|nr:GntR family transcriptional regulator [Paracoccaceae bacterium]